MICAENGDEDAKRLFDRLGFSNDKLKEDGVKKIPEEKRQILLSKLVPGFSAMVESRFEGTNAYIARSGVRQVVDLPCGYTSRGIRLAESGIRYFGLDLPAVIDAMSPAVEDLIGENKNISYRAVDATNYASLREALGEDEGELLITTEGMLMYFTQPETEEVFRNIRRLLLEFGGCWITTDNTLIETQKKVMEVIVGSDDSGSASDMGIKIASSMAKTKNTENDFFDKDKARQFVDEMGFELETVSVRGYLPEVLHSYDKLSDDVRTAAREALGTMDIWVMTPKEAQTESFTCEGQSFNASVERKEDMLKISLRGRLDTITSPELLALFREAEKKGAISQVAVDLTELEYISSAGLRVMMLIRKAIPDTAPIRFTGASQPVREIFETTGFSQMFDIV